MTRERAERERENKSSKTLEPHQEGKEEGGMERGVEKKLNNFMI